MTAIDATVDELASNPHPILARARRLGSVVRLDALDAWLVTDRATAVAVMRDPETFTVDDPRFSTGQVIGASMLSTDGAEHRRHREPFNDWFSSGQALTNLDGWIRGEVAHLVEAIVDEGQAELRSVLAAPLAANTVTHLLGLDPSGSDDLVHWYRDIVEAVHTITVGGEPGPGVASTSRELRAATLAAADNGRANALARARQILGDDDLAANAAVIAFGGIETAEGTIANALWHLLADREIHATIVQDPTLVPAFVEESLRLEPAAANIDRYTTTDTRLGEVDLRAGDYVIVSLAAANRDPAVFHEPDILRLDRPNARLHTTFARGPHACLGIHIARAQTIATIETVLDRLPGLALDADASAPPSGLVFRKPPAVTVTWDPP